MSFSDFSRKFIRPLAFLLSKIGVHPTLITLTSFLLTSSGVVWIVLGKPAIGVLWFLLFAPFDALDGEVARLSGKNSRFGAFLDSSLDRVVDGLVFSALAYVFRNDAILLMLSLTALVSSYLISYLRARAEGLGGELKEGMMSRYPRFIGLLILLIIWNSFEGILRYFFALYDLFLIFTVFQRFFIAYKRLSGL